MDALVESHSMHSHIRIQAVCAVGRRNESDQRSNPILEIKLTLGRIQAFVQRASIEHPLMIPTGVETFFDI